MSAAAAAIARTAAVNVASAGRRYGKVTAGSIDCESCLACMATLEDRMRPLMQGIEDVLLQSSSGPRVRSPTYPLRQQFLHSLLKLILLTQ